MSETTKHTKDTNRGLPPGWRWVRLGEVCKQDRQIVEARSPLAISLTYLSLEHVEANTGRIRKDPSVLIEDEGASTTFAFDSRHVLYGKLRPYLNKVALPDFRGRCTTEIIPLLPLDGVDRGFLCWTFRRAEMVEAAMQGKTGSRMPRADMDELMQLKIPLPSLAEQRRIAALLDARMAAVERARAAAQAQLDEAKALPAAYLRQTFPRPGQDLPAGWRWVRLGDVCELNPKRPLLARADDALTTFIPMPAVDEKQGMIARPEVRPYAEVNRGYTYFAEGDVLFAKITPCMQNGKHAIARGLIDGIGFGSTEFHVIRPGPDIRPEWIHFFIRQPYVLQNATAHFKGAVGQQRVPEGFLAELALPLPSSAEQRRIAAQLSEQMTAAERLRAGLEAQLNDINALPAALLRQTFNGEL